MTEYFEVLERDGPARLGTVRLTDPVATPGVIDGSLENAGSRWATEPSLPNPRSDVVTMLPHRGFPPGTDERVIDAFDEVPPAFDGPAGTAITTQTAGDRGTDVYAVSNAQSIVGHAAAFCESIVHVREELPDDVALYLSGVATPANIAMLVYAGIDLVDETSARIAGSQGHYLTREGSWPVADLSETPCACPHCEKGTVQSDVEALIDHNVATLRAELATVRERIRQGRLRGYVSAQVRHDSWQTAALREFDGQYTYLEQHEPIYRRNGFDATTEDDLRHPAVRRFIERVTSRYRNRFRTPLVLLPCSATKPYSESQSHGQFRGAIAYRAHRVSLSSPVGVVPQELECTYPAQHYDIPVTGEWSPTERSIVGEALRDYLARNEYPRVIGHVPPGPYREIVTDAATDLGLDVTFTVEDHATTGASLTALEEALEGELKYTKRTRHENTVRAIADYQFGAGAGDELFGDITIEAPWPKHRVLDENGELLATMVPEYGVLALTIAGATRWVQSPVATRRVDIDDFVPHGDVLAPGIIEADEGIRIGDEVIVEGPSAFAIGRARMHGRAMCESTRGVAVDIRHCEEQT